MTRISERFINISLSIIVIVLLVAAIGSAFTKTPFLITAIRSNSMYPLYERGDLVFLRPLLEKDNLQIGDIIIFKTEDGILANQGWIAHRIIGGNKINGYLTKGDSNENTDQYNDGPAIKPEWISNKVITISGQPLKIPLLGNLPLIAEQFQKNPYTLPVITVILAAVIGISEITGNKKKTKHKNHKIELALIYFLGGITISIMLGASMVTSSEHLRLPYEVSDTTKGVIMGSNVGVLKLGEVVERPLSDLENKGFFPVIAVITSDNNQIGFSHQSLILSPGQKVEATMKVSALIPGKYESLIHVGIFFPFLPKGLITYLAQISYWSAVVVVSLLPGLPLMLYPFFESRLRRSISKQINRLLRKIRAGLSFG